MLRFRADIRTLAFISLYFVLQAAAWVWVPFQWRYVLPTVVLLSVVAWINAVITHNVLHNPLFRKRGLNRLAQVVLSISYGFPVSEYLPGHNFSHHKYTQQRRDVMRTTKVRYSLNIINLLMFFVHVGSEVTKTNIKFMSEAKRKTPKLYQQFLLETVVTWGFKLAMLAIDWRKGLVFIMIPALYAVWGITTVNYLQHDGCHGNSEYNHSRNFVGNVFNWFTFNNGFHTMHHMEPGLHWSLLPEKHSKLVQPHIDPRLDQPSLLVYLFRAFVLPGQRQTFDGKEISFAVEDEPAQEIQALTN
jgi:fatty acid desaturase